MLMRPEASGYAAEDILVSSLRPFSSGNIHGSLVVVSKSVY